jgi:hypothetical protein
MSREITVKSGVPQGSHLGPLLFIIFINDICSIFENAKCLLYADDMKLFMEINHTTDCKLLQQDLKQLNNWCQQNRMQLKIKKCVAMTFCRKSTPITYDYRIGPEIIERVSMVRDLGILLDPKLDFKANVDHIVSKASSMLGFVKRQARVFSCPYVTKALFCSLVRSTLEYCVVVWSPQTVLQKNRIESVQKQFLLFALRGLNWQQGYQLPSYTARLNLLKMETLEQRRLVSDLMFVFDIMKGIIKVPALSSLVITRTAPRVTRLACSTQLLVPYASTRYAADETVSRCCRLFNCFSQLYDDRCSREVFRKRITEHLRNTT